MPERTRHVIGCMTGTSLDGLDAALVRITGEGLAMRAAFLGMVSHPLGDLVDTLRSFANGDPHAPLDYLRAARRLGELHATACTELLRNHAGVEAQPPLDFVVAHGQTIWHAPRDHHGHLSWQLFDPWPLARQLRVPVCYDLRQADLIAGGEGAPITPIADWVMYRSDEPVRAILNLGGIANMTVLYDRPELTGGGDIGPCNILIDGFVREAFPGMTFDRDGEIARGGREFDARTRIRRHPIFAAIAARRSLGREFFAPEWFRAILDETDVEHGETPAGVVAGAVAVVVEVITAALNREMPYRVVLAGGGARNRFLVESLEGAAAGSYRVTLSDDLGIPVEAREATAFAVLGALSQDGVPITLPQVTGSTTPGRAGAWVYP